MKYLMALKSYKRIRGHDGQGFQARLYWNGKPVADIFDDGWGGDFQIAPRDDHEKERLLLIEEKVRLLPPYALKPYGDGDVASYLDMEISIMIGDLVTIADAIVYDSKGSPVVHNPVDEYEFQYYKLTGGKRVAKAEWDRVAELLVEKFPDWTLYERAEFHLDVKYDACGCGRCSACITREEYES